MTDLAPKQARISRHTLDADDAVGWVSLSVYAKRTRIIFANCPFISRHSYCSFFTCSCNSINFRQRRQVTCSFIPVVSVAFLFPQKAP